MGDIFTWMGLGQALADLAPVVAAVAGLLGSLWLWGRRRWEGWHKFWGDALDGLRSLPELREDLRGIRYYVAPNGGGSLSDAVIRTESAVRTLTERTDLMVQTAWAEWDADDEVARFHCCGTTGETIYVNQLYARWLGGGKTELLRWGWLNFVHPDDRARVREEWDLCREEHRVYLSTHRLVSTDGDVIEVRVTATPIPDSAPAKRWIGSIKRARHDRRKTQTEQTIRQ